MKNYWWIHGEPRPGLRNSIKNLSRCIVTPEVAKHRLFIWISTDIIPDHKLHVFSRDDDYFFGVLHSRLHEIWSLKMGSWMGVGNDPSYSSSRTFETFPFPFVPGQEPMRPNASSADTVGIPTDTMYGVPTNAPLDNAPNEEISPVGTRYIASANTADAEIFTDTADDWQKYQAISAAAKMLHEERQAWLNNAPLQRFGEGSGVGSKDRTLTNLYNALNVFRGVEKIKTVAAAGDFAPRLDALHKALDAAVCAAYGWPAEILADDEAILGRLLALNLARAQPHP